MGTKKRFMGTASFLGGAYWGVILSIMLSKRLLYPFLIVAAAGLLCVAFILRGELRADK